MRALSCRCGELHLRWVDLPGEGPGGAGDGSPTAGTGDPEGWPDRWRTYRTGRVEVAYTLDAGAVPQHALRGGRERITEGETPAHVLAIARLAEQVLQIFEAAPLGLRRPVGMDQGQPLRIRLLGLDPAGPIDFRGQTDPRWDHVAIDRDLVDRAALLTLGHEIFHRIQYAYNATTESSQGFYAAMREGGARLAEECVRDSANRYVQDGYLEMPARPLVASAGNAVEPHAYSAGLFWKYVCEQHGRLAEAPGVPSGFDAYVHVLEATSSACGAPYRIAELRRARAHMQGNGHFDRFLRLDDPGGGELVSTETTWGNFLVANWLHGTADPGPDRRFEYEEDSHGGGQLAARRAHLAAQVGIPDVGAQTTLSRGDARPMPPYSASYYLLELGNIKRTGNLLSLSFAAGGGMTDPLVQLLLIGPGGTLVDLVRLDATAWKRTVNCQELEGIVAIVSTRETEGSFTLSIQQDQERRPLVSSTRWNCDAGDSYEMDPREQPWTWTSPDLLVVKDGDGGRIRLRVRNRGNAAAGRVAARVEWQDGSTGLDTSRWQHVGTGELTGLEPDQEGWLEIPWSPPHGEQAYALRATITADDDPTTDDKTVISTFGRIALPGFADAVLS